MPLLIFFLLNLSSVIEMIRLHGNLELALTNIGNTLSVYGYVAEMTDLGDTEENLGVLKEFAETALSYLLVKESMENFLGEEYLDRTPLVGGSEGILGTTWEFTEGKDVIQITIGYVLQCPFSVPGFHKLVMLNNYYGHIWNGYEIPGAAQGNVSETVYVTAYGSVYHDRMNCSYLDLSISEVELSELKTRRNADGKLYVLCNYCNGETYDGTVFITNWGECYHYKRNCSGLVRKIYSMTLTEATQEGLWLCSRCEKEE